jgi:hypothetical protein
MPVSRTRPGSRRRAARLAAAALAAATAVGAAACGSGAPSAAGHPASPGSPSSSGSLAASGLCGAAAQVDSLTVQRSDALPGNHARFAFPATEHIHNAPRAQAVAQSLCGLMPVPHTPVACPADFGITYTLTFAAGTHQFAPVTLNAAGCEMVHGLGAVRRVTASDIVWRQLGTAIGIPQPNQASFAGSSGTSS